jgi:hypothetical protein
MTVVRTVVYPEENSCWVHNKTGEQYKVLCVARNTETGVDEVIYRNSFGKSFARPVNMWEDYVVNPNDLDEYMQRFSRVLKGNL